MNQLYIDLFTSRPDLFQNVKDKHALKIIMDADRIRKYENEKGAEIGVLYQDQYIMLLKDLVQRQNETENLSTYIRVVHTAKKESVVILPMLGDGIVCVDHFRHSTRQFHWEIPRGFAKDSISIQENAQLELLEETGYSVKGLCHLGTVYPDTGLFNGHAQVYSAKVDENKKQEPTDKHEAIREVRLVPLEQVKRMIQAGKITDGYTLSALAMYWAREIV